MNLIYLITFFALFYVIYRLHRDISVLRVQIQNLVDDQNEQDAINEVLMSNEKSLDVVMKNHKEVIEDLYRRIGGEIIEVHDYSEMTH